MYLTKVFGIISLTLGLTVNIVPAQADNFKKVKTSGKMTCAMSGAFPPFSFVNDKNNVVGFDVDICKELAKELGVEAKIVTTAWDGIIAGLITGRYDTIIGSMTITKERQKAIDFAGPYYRSGIGVFVANNAPAKSLTDLKGKTIAVTLGEQAEQWARVNTDWNVRTYKGLPELLLELKSGRVDAIASDDIPVLLAVKKNKEAIRQIPTPELGKGDIGIGLRKDSPEFKAALQNALDKIMDDGTYLTIANKWVGSDIR